MTNETKTTYFVRNITGRWEVWSSVDYVVKSAWRMFPFLNFVSECENEVEAIKLCAQLNKGS